METTKQLSGSQATRASIAVIVMRIVTRFTTTEQFVAGFHPLCTETTVFIPTYDGKQIGVEAEFSIRLADGTPMLRGLCVVDEMWTTVDNPFRRAGVLLSIRSITVDSRTVFEQIQLARLANVPTVASCAIVPQNDTSLHESSPDHLSPDVFATIEMAPLFPGNTRLPGGTLHDDDAGELGIDVDTAGLPIIVNDEATERMTGVLAIPVVRSPLSTILGVAPLFRLQPTGLGPLPVVAAAIVDGPTVTVLVRTAPRAPVPHRWSGIASAARAARAFIAHVGLRLIGPLRRRRRERSGVSRERVRRPRVAFRALTGVCDPRHPDAPISTGEEKTQPRSSVVT